MNPVKPLDSQMQLLGKVLDLRAEKAQLISTNIANAETPGYKASHFEFEEDLARAMGNQNGLRMTTSNPRHMPLSPGSFASVGGKVVFDEDKTGIGDENSVKVDQEMLDLSENELYYETAAQLLKKKLTMLKYVISGGQ